MAIYSLTTLAQNIPTQAELARNGLLKYFTELPATAPSYLAHALDMGDYQLFVSEHKKYENHLRPNTPFDVFYSNADKRFPKHENSYPFLNNDPYFNKMVTEKFGFCSGVTLTLRRFNLLSYYDPKGQVEKAPAPGSHSFYDFYKKKIDRILISKMPTIIPGFKNLYEMSSNTELKRYIKLHVIKEWVHSSVAIWRGVIQQLYSVTGTFTQDEADSLYEEISYKVNVLGYNPVVWLSEPNKDPFDKKQWIHVMQVYGITKRREVDGFFQLKVWDINEHAESAAKVINISNSGVKFEGTKLVEVEVLHFDDYEIAEIIKNKLDFCADHRGLCTQKKSTTPGTKMSTANGGFQNSRL